MTNKLNVELIVAADEDNGIGKNDMIPWKLSGDMTFFKRTTTFQPNKPYKKNNVVLMGRRTWESIPEKFRPLRDRLNIVLTKQTPPPKSLRLFSSELRSPNTIDLAIQVIKQHKDPYTDPELNEAERVLLNREYNDPKVFVIGGESIYRLVLTDPRFNVERIYLTRVFDKFDCDAVFPIDKVPQSFTVDWYSEIFKENNLSYQFQIWQNNQ